VTDTDEPKFVEAVNISGKFAHILFADGTHDEVPLAPPRTVGELRALIEHLPDATPVLTSGYEAYWDQLANVQIAEVQEMDGLFDFVGSYLTPADAELEVAGDGESGWQCTVEKQQPTRVGEPVFALILARGRP
jgi:hypothetical protein